MFRRLLIGGLAIGAATSAFALAPVGALAITEVGRVPQWYSNGHLVGPSSAPELAIAWNELQLESGAVGKIHCSNVMNFSVWNENGRGVGQFEGWGTNACKAPELEQFLETTYEELCKTNKIKCPISVYATGELPLRVESREGVVCKEESKKPENCLAEGERETIPLPLPGTQGLTSGLHRRASGFPWKMKLVRIERNEEEVVLAQLGIPPKETESCSPEVEGHSAGWEKVPAGCLKLVVVCPQIPVEVVFFGHLEPLVINGVHNALTASQFQFNSEAGKLQSSEGEAPETTAVGKMKFIGRTEAALNLLVAK